MTMHVTLRSESGTSIIKLYNARQAALRGITLNYWLPGSATVHRDTAFLDLLAAGDAIAFDVLDAGLHITKLSFSYYVGSRRYETDVMPAASDGPNAYVRDVMYAFAEDEHDTVAGFVVQDEMDARRRGPALDYQQAVDLRIGIDSSLLSLSESSEQVAKRALGATGRVECIDLRCEAPAVQSYQLVLKDMSGEVVRVDTLKQTAGWRRARLDFVQGPAVSSAWAEWTCEGESIASVPKRFDAPLMWGEYAVAADGRSGAMWIWLDWFMVRRRDATAAATKAHAVTVIGQRKSMGCWLACFTMLYAWKLGREVTLGEMIKSLGGEFQVAAMENTGITPAQAETAAAMLDMTVGEPNNPTVDHWVDMAARGPLFVIGKEQRYPGLTAVHAKIVVAVNRVPSSALAEVEYIDPASNNLAGGRGRKSLRDFIAEYEALADSGWRGVQIIAY